VTQLAASGDLSLMQRLHEALEQFLREENFYGRDLIADILAGIAGTAALPELLRASSRDLGDDQDGLQSEIIDLLQADPAGARAAVLDAVASGTSELRRTGVWALGFIAGAGDVPTMAAAATDLDRRVRSLAIRTVPDPAGDDQAFLVLTRALDDDDDDVRSAAVTRLGAIGRADAAGPLTALAADSAPRVRRRVAYALGRLGRNEAAPALLRLLRDHDRSVREHAAEALGSVGGPEAIAALVALARDKDPQQRALAATALANAAGGEASARQQLVALARDDVPAVRAATVSGLASAHASPHDWAAVITRLADDPDPLVRRYVAVAARLVAPQHAADILRGYASDPDQAVRETARGQLGSLTSSGHGEISPRRGGA
jgi:HEAT repeat protein